MGCGCNKGKKKGARRPGGINLRPANTPPPPTNQSSMAPPASMGMVNLPPPAPGGDRRIKFLQQQAVLKNRGLA